MSWRSRLYAALTRWNRMMARLEARCGVDEPEEIAEATARREANASRLAFGPRKYLRRNHVWTGSRQRDHRGTEAWKERREIRAMMARAWEDDVVTGKRRAQNRRALLMRWKGSVR